ncbi:hypothetical protein [Bradyrhizobium liaoningense]
MYERLSALVQQLIAMRARTLPALQAKAAVLAQHLVDIHRDSEIDRDAYDMVRSMVMDLGGDFPFHGSRGATEMPEDRVA